MRVLLLLDPGDRSKETQSFYIQLFSIISNWITTKYFYSDLKYEGNYYEDVFNNTINENYQDSFKKELESYGNFDLVITNSPNPIVREVFDYVLNLSIGIYSRPPFPIYYQLDPWGILWKSFTYNAPRFNLSNHKNSERLKKKINFIEQKNKINLFPFNSEYWFLKIQGLKKTQAEYFQEFDKTNDSVYWTSKPSFSVFNDTHEFNYDYLQLLPKNKKIEKNSSLLIPNCKKIWATHSTLGFQAALWNVEIESPSCFYYWKGNQSGTIGALLDIVWFNDKYSFYDRIEKLKQYKKCPENLYSSFDTIEKYINHDTHFYRL
jgi:hypothetical protein